jgi:hypothetical protein
MSNKAYDLLENPAGQSHTRWEKTDLQKTEKSFTQNTLQAPSYHRQNAANTPNNVI